MDAKPIGSSPSVPKDGLGKPEGSARPPSDADAERFAGLVQGESAATGAAGLPGCFGAPLGDAPKGFTGGGNADGPNSDEQAGGLADLLGQAAKNLMDAPGLTPNIAVDGGRAAGAGGVETPSPANRSRCEELVERILVSQPRGDGASEVRIKLDRDWLPDTEVRLVKPSGGELSVEFVSDRLESQRFLMPNLSSLRERLAERTGDPVTVRMTEHMDSGANPGDGRSRNRRNLYEEYKGSGE